MEVVHDGGRGLLEVKSLLFSTQEIICNMLNIQKNREIASGSPENCCFKAKSRNTKDNMLAHPRVQGLASTAYPYSDWCISMLLHSTLDCYTLCSTQQLDCCYGHIFIQPAGAKMSK